MYLTNYRGNIIQGFCNEINDLNYLHEIVYYSDNSPSGLFGGRLYRLLEGWITFNTIHRIAIFSDFLKQPIDRSDSD